MNKRQLVDRMSAEGGPTTKQSEKTLNGPMDVIHTELSPGGTVSLIGFGVSRVTNRKSRMARNSKTGEEMEIKVRRIPVFRASLNLRQAVNSKQLDGGHTSEARIPFD